MESERLTDGQKKFIAARITGKTITESIEIAGVARATYYYWRSNSEAFNRCLDTAKARQWKDALETILCQNELAIKTLRDVCTDGSESNKLRAAESILSNVWKGASVAEFDQRLRKIEEALGIEDAANDCQATGEDRAALSPEYRQADPTEDPA